MTTLTWNRPRRYLLTGLCLGLCFCAPVWGAAAEDLGSPAHPEAALRTVGLGIAAALAISLSVIGAGYAVGRIGSAALGAAAEKPELLIRSLLFVALAEGLAVLGFAIAMILVQKI